MLNSPLMVSRCSRALLLILSGLILAGGGCRRDASGSETTIHESLAQAPAALREAIERARARAESAGSAEAWSELGRLYHANGYFESAEAAYRRWLDRDSRSARATYFLADVARALGNPAEERARLEQVVRLDPQYAPARLWLAEACFKAGDSSGAREHYEAVLELRPNDAHALLGLARQRLQAGDPAGARAQLETLTAQHPAFSSGFAMLAPLVEKSGEKGRAAALRQQARARKDPPPADPWLDELVARCFDLQRLGIGFEDRFKAGLGDEALRYLERMEVVAREDWQVRRFRGTLLAQQGLTDAAIADFDAALQAKGEPESIYPLLVDTLIDAERLPAAEQRAREGLRAAPRSATLRTALAELSWRRKDLAAARRWAEEALALAPQDLAARRLLGRIHWEAGAQAAALPHLEAVARLSPDDVPARAMLGEYHLEAGSPEAALTPLQEAWAQEPGNNEIGERLALAWLRLGNQQARAGRSDLALAHYDEAISVRPVLLEAYVNKSRVLLAQGRGAAAVDAFRPLLAQESANGEVYLMFGDVLQATGRGAEAAEAWRQALGLTADGANPTLRAALQQRLDRGEGAPR